MIDSMAKGGIILHLRAKLLCLAFEIDFVQNDTVVCHSDI